MTVDDLRIANGGEIRSNSVGPGVGGQIKLATKNLTIDGRGGRFVTGISANALGTGPSSGAAGAIEVTADTLRIIDGGEISSASFGPGAGGRIKLVAKDLSIDRMGANFFTGIAANAQGTEGPSGAAGTIDVMANDLRIVNGGEISSSSFGPGAGGQMKLAAKTLTIDGAGSRFETGMFANASGRGPSSGAAGAIDVTADDLRIVNGGGIGSSSFGPGAGGQIKLVAGGLTIDGMNSALLTGVAAVSIGNGIFGGATGSLNIETGIFSIRNGGVVTTFSRSGRPGGNIDIAVADLLSLQQAEISTEAVSGDGGKIGIAAGAVELRGGEITTTVLSSTGNGGDMNFRVGALVLDNGRIQANAARGNGGNIRIVADQLITHPGRPAVIQASSELGIDGQINVTTPGTDASGGLVALSPEYIDSSDLLAESCAARATGAQNSLVLAGRGGLPPAPDGPGIASYGTRWGEAPAPAAIWETRACADGERP